MLQADLPAGTTENSVERYLSDHRYVTEPADRPGTLVAIIPGPGTNKPAAVHARVIFYFDATGKLNTFEVVPAPGQPTSR
jgi:hypothetical protein